MVGSDSDPQFRAAKAIDRVCANDTSTSHAHAPPERAGGTLAAGTGSCLAWFRAGEEHSSVAVKGLRGKAVVILRRCTGSSSTIPTDRPCTRSFETYRKTVSPAESAEEPNSESVYPRSHGARFESLGG